MGGAAIQAVLSNMWEFSLSVFNQEVIEAVTSPTHLIAVNREAEKVTVSLSGTNSDQSLASDLVVLIKHKQPHGPKAFVELGMENGKNFMKQAAVMVNFFPDFTNLPTQSVQHEFMFLVDRSGSMGGFPIENAKDTLLLILKSLPENCCFNIIGFGSRYVKLFQKGSVKYSQATLDEAVHHVKRICADLGGTELLPPLTDILNVAPLAGFSREVFVLTDGSVSNTHSCINIVKRNESHSR